MWRTYLGTLFTSVIALCSFGQQPVLEVTHEALTITSIPAGGSIALLSVAREPAGGIARVVPRRELLTDVDGDGEIRYEVPPGISSRSVWIIVDTSTGAVAVGAPPGTRTIAMRPHGAGEGLPVQAAVNAIDIGREEVSVLLVRPGKGAWAGVVRDGSLADRDGQANGRILLDPSKLTTLGEAFPAAPPAILPGDVIAIIDPSRLEYWHQTAPRGEK